ncbi:MAG: hypothetical protein RLZZ241_1498 [Bacteroidota bacterium]|jgi:hypothetical protein
MRRLVILTGIGLLLNFTLAFSQIPKNPQIGAVYEIVKPNGAFEYLEVPKANFIRKRGSISDPKSLHGNRVVISEVLDHRGHWQVVLTREDGNKFFRFYPSLKAHWPEVLDSGEIRSLEK